MGWLSSGHLPRLEIGKERQVQLHDYVTCGSHSAWRTCRVINVAGDQHAALDHKHTYMHVVSYGIISAGLLLSPTHKGTSMSMTTH